MSSALPRADPITQLPIVILEPHNRCNCRCLMCDIWLRSSTQEVSSSDIEQWLEEWRSLGVSRVMLTGGEPLMHSHLWKMCESLRSAGIGITLLSTGILLKRDATRLVQYCDHVIVSLDGPREIHNRIRNLAGAYEKLAEGVAAVRTADSSVLISGRCTVQRANCRALAATVAAAHDLGLDRISFLAADVSSEAFNRPDGWDVERTESVSLREADLPLLVAELDALEDGCRADFASGYIEETPTKLRRRLYQHSAALLGRGDFHPVDCNAPWVSTFIESDGSVRPCFFQPPLGNLRETGSLREILNSDEAILWRRGLDMGRDEICRKCVCSLQFADSETSREGCRR